MYPDGFLIPRPDGGNFLSVSYFNSEHDPFKEMEERPMERGDILISSPIKTGNVSVLPANWEMQDLIEVSFAFNCHLLRSGFAGRSIILIWDQLIFYHRLHVSQPVILHI